VPSLILLGPKNIGPCQGIDLLTAHTRSGNRPMTYTWSFSASPKLTAEEITNINSVLASSESQLSLNASLLPLLQESVDVVFPDLLLLLFSHV
jgi:hypothetical protein